MLLFGMLAVVLVYTDIQLRGTFEEMCNFPKIKFWPRARIYHKVNGVKKYHIFLNITQAITGKDHGSHDIFIQNEKNLSTRGTVPQWMIPT